MSKNLTWSILKRFSTRDTYGFALQDVVKEFPEKNPVHLARVLAGMVEEGMLRKISRGVYHIIPLNADPDTYVPDGTQVAKYMIKNEKYYLGYASAMKVHGLTPQSVDREFVVTKMPMKPATRSFAGITCQFVRHDTSGFFGFSDLWINQTERAMVSDLEKTLADIASKPGYGGGIMEVGNALYKAKERTDHEKLFYCLVRNGNKSAKKRLLFLTDLLGLEWTDEHDQMMEDLGSGISLLDTSEPDQGRKNTKFGLKINVDPDNLQKKILT